jgi:hypothetical protein
MTTRTYTIPPAYYADHLSRDCGATGRIIRETKRQVTVELDAVAYLDLTSDCEWFIDTAGMGGFDSPGFSPIGLRRSAEATLKALKADPFTDEELADGKREWDRLDAERREASREAMKRINEQMQADRERREAEAAAHPRVTAEYAVTWRGDGIAIYGVPSNENLKIGTIIVSNGAPLEVIALGDIGRGGKVDARLRHQATGAEHDARLELGRIVTTDNRKEQ